MIQSVVPLFVDMPEPAHFGIFKKKLITCINTQDFPNIDYSIQLNLTKPFNTR